MSFVSRRELLAAAAVAPFTHVAWGEPPKLTVATFSEEVTPPIGHPCMGGGIAPVKEIVDPLFAHGFVLEGAGEPIAVVAVDWCEIRNDAYDQWRDLIAEATGTKRLRVLVSALHQHDAPVDGAVQRLGLLLGRDREGHARAREHHRVVEGKDGEDGGGAVVWGHSEISAVER